jgi:hypothetical protein
MVFFTYIKTRAVNYKLLINKGNRRNIDTNGLPGLHEMCRYILQSLESKVTGSG